MAPGLTSEKDNQMLGCMKNNSVVPEVILEQMRQQADERRRGEGPSTVRDAWAPVLADSGTRVGDIRVEFEEDDPQYVWRLKTMLDNERKSVKLLKTMLVHEDDTIGKQNGEIERLQEENEWQEAEIKSLQKDKVCLQEENERLQQEIERLRDESAVVRDNERLRAEAVAAVTAADLAAKAAAKVAKLVEGLEVALLCPISQELMDKPVVSRYGHTYS
jgi:hypothetical protein